MWNHTAGCKCGERFPTLCQFRKKDIDTRTPWILSGMVTTIPELWNEVICLQKKDWEWEGWMLLIITKKLFPWCNPQNKGSNPFSCQHAISD